LERSLLEETVTEVPFEENWAVNGSPTQLQAGLFLVAVDLLLVLLISHVSEVSLLKEVEKTLSILEDLGK
jgi:hypothetical protein